MSKKGVKRFFIVLLYSCRGLLFILGVCHLLSLVIPRNKFNLDNLIINPVFWLIVCVVVFYVELLIDEIKKD
ncbi:hypothetical protein SAMN04488516_1122 [Desulfonauticus submarinus]|uniref:Uncharacterized protein n=1 Tax=Desulfonauticus submarinus TaxID=206665 RepID=A0A1H0FDS8_9BACT|nr:hypothetical protein [Desulfonauticus submarinus]SDN92726.1 hypothetical protein SAMN04488516_1122 [Desulfonauticus submarinus]